MALRSTGILQALQRHSRATCPTTATGTSTATTSVAPETLPFRLLHLTETPEALIATVLPMHRFLAPDTVLRSPSILAIVPMRVTAHLTTLTTMPMVLAPSPLLLVRLSLLMAHLRDRTPRRLALSATLRPNTTTTRARLPSLLRTLTSNPACPLTPLLTILMVHHLALTTASVRVAFPRFLRVSVNASASGTARARLLVTTDATALVAGVPLTGLC